MSNCGKCHTCSTILRSVLDGEEYCDTCGRYQRYQSHGWATIAGENNPCYLQKFECSNCKEQTFFPMGNISRPPCPKCFHTMFMIGNPIPSWQVIRAKNLFKEITERNK